MNVYVAAGRTYHLKGVLAAGNTLYAEQGSDSSSAGAIVQVRGGATNDGVINILASAAYGVFGASGATLAVSGQLTNMGQINISGGGAASHYGGGSVTGAQLINTGVLTNQGTITIGAASYAPQEGHAGTAGTLLDSGKLTNAGALILQGGAYGDGYGIAPAAQANVTGTLTNSGLIALQIYQFTYAGHVYTAGGAGATLTDSGNLTNTGTILISGSNGAYAGSFYKPTAPALVISGVLVNHGAIDVQGATTGGLGGTVIDSGKLTNAGRITLYASVDGSNAGALSVANGGTLTQTGTISGGGTVYNAGVIGSVGHGVTSGEIATAGLVNDGTVNVSSSGALTITSAVTSDVSRTGQFSLTGHSLLALDGAVSSSEQVSFPGAGATLGIGDVADFHAVLANIGSGTILDFIATAVGGAATSGDALRVGVGSNVYVLNLAQPLAGNLAITLSSDGHGGTDLYFTKASAPSAVVFAVPHTTG